MGDAFLASEDGGKPIAIAFVGDRTIFHDIFRGDYGVHAPAQWLLGYLSWRRAIDKSNVIFHVASTTLSALREELARLKSRGYEYEPPKVLTAIHTFTKITDLPKDVNKKHAPLYIAKILSDLDITPLLVTSQSDDTMKERIHDAGLAMSVEGFTPNMSFRRISQGSWCYPVTASQACAILASYDPVFQHIVRSLGPPPQDNLRR